MKLPATTSAPASRRFRLPAAILGVVLTLAGAVALNGCALARPEKRPISNRVASTIVPEEPGKRLMMTPILIPVGLMAILGDALIVHPISEMDDSWRHATRYCSAGYGRPGHYVSDAASMPLRAVGLPLVLLVNYPARLLADIPPVPGSSSDRPPDFFSWRRDERGE